ncbi:MAG TPA: class I SAM-dependent methyltransferase [Acidimicrobiales bacterium]|nr:class I SAM-dependent methyltransferase [Acidimicrobiales bacterium]
MPAPPSSWRSVAHGTTMVVVTEFDPLAEHYDETRGGESRGDEYAADVDAQLPPGEGPVLEIGVGTGVVAVGLRRRRRAVVGLDLSAPMLARARWRLGPVVVLSDAMQMSIATASVAHAVSVWVVHSVTDPVALFHEAARVIRPGGRYVVCANQHPSGGDEVGRIIAEMGARVDARRGASRPRGVSVDEVLAWAGAAGFTGHVHQLERRWRSSPTEELTAIASRAWPALRELDEEAVEEVTRPAVEALRALPSTDADRRATAEMIVFRRP